MAALSFFANFFVPEALVEPGDATATVSNIAGSQGLFRGGGYASALPPGQRDAQGCCSSASRAAGVHA